MGIFHLISGTFSAVGQGVMHAGWKATRSFHDGAMGKSSVNGVKTWKNVDTGKATTLNPAQKLARRLKADAQQMVTGNVIDPTTMQAQKTNQGWLGRNVGNRIKGGLHLAADTAIGVPGTMLGWGTRGVAITAGMVAKPVTRLAGETVVQGTKFGVETGADLLRTVVGANGYFGKETLFAAGLIGVAGAGVVSSLGSNFAGDGASKNMGIYYGGSIDSLPGTLASQGAGEQSNVMVDTGADGDLVFAMHNLR